MRSGDKRILIAGASGYIGTQLALHLRAEGCPIRLMARTIDGLMGSSDNASVEIVQADALDASSLGAALENISTAYYLIHSMAAGRDFIERDCAAARNFAAAAKDAAVERIIYLGGLGDPDSNLSQHLRSRQEVGKILAQTGVPVTEFRAAVIVGAGSLSFEMIRYLTERIPVMICPRWVFTRIQPIAIGDVLNYLTHALNNSKSVGKVIEIGGSDILQYADLMRIYARLRGLRRCIVRVPVLTPRLSSYWVHLVTPISSSLAIPLIQGLKNEVVVKQPDAAALFPDLVLKDYRNAVRAALNDLHPDKINISSAEIRISKRWPLPKLLCIHSNGMIIESQRFHCDNSPQRIFEVLERLGGSNGWLGLDWIWRLRGWGDRLFGGKGFKRSHPNRPALEPDDQVDCFTVEQIERPKNLLFRINYKLPGQGWLKLSTHPRPENKCEIAYTVYFAPKGLWGILYWYSVLLPHRIVFLRLLKRIAAASAAQQPTPG